MNPLETSIRRVLERPDVTINDRTGRERLARLIAYEVADALTYNPAWLSMVARDPAHIEGETR